MIELLTKIRDSQLRLLSKVEEDLEKLTGKFISRNEDNDGRIERE